MQRTRVTRHQHTLGDWVRVRRAPDVRLSGLLLDRELLGYQHSRAQFASWLEPPRPQLTLNREFRELAGTTPSDFVRRLIPDGGVIGDRSH